MANTIATLDDTLEKEVHVSHSPPTSPLEDTKPQEQPEATLDQNEPETYHDKTSIKSTEDTPRARNGDNAELPPEPPVELPGPPEKDYSILSVTEKRMVVFAASVTSLLSPMATAIYCEYLESSLSWDLTLTIIDPSLDTISRELNVSNSKINITVTVFLVRLPCSFRKTC